MGNLKCVYHSSDLDGQCSAAIVKRKYSHCEFIPIDYHIPFPWDKISKDDEVIMVDFHLQPVELMDKLNAFVKNLIWIDHHSSAMTCCSEDILNLPGKRSLDDIAACELTWEYLFSDQEVPVSVKYLGRYDVGDHNYDKAILPFQYGMRSLNSYPGNMELWERLFQGDYEFRSKIIEEGFTVLKYLKLFYRDYLESHLIKVEFEGFNAVALNVGRVGSIIFDGLMDKYDLFITFSRLSKLWSFRLYSPSNFVDCGKIARKYGGGGHEHAAGFSVSEIPFKI